MQNIPRKFKVFLIIFGIINMNRNRKGTRIFQLLSIVIYSIISSDIEGIFVDFQGSFLEGAL